VAEDELITLDLGLGMWISDTFGLWQGNTALLLAWAQDELPANATAS